MPAPLLEAGTVSLPQDLEVMDKFQEKHHPMEKDQENLTKSNYQPTAENHLTVAAPESQKSQPITVALVHLLSFPPKKSPPTVVLLLPVAHNPDHVAQKVLPMAHHLDLINSAQTKEE